MPLVQVTSPGEGVNVPRREGERLSLWGGREYESPVSGGEVEGRCSTPESSGHCDRKPNVHAGQKLRSVFRILPTLWPCSTLVFKGCDVQ